MHMTEAFMFVVISCLTTETVFAQLIVNVKNGAGDVIVENIRGDTDSDSIQLEFKSTDGTFVTQVIDFKSEIQIFRTYVLGEEEKGQPQFHIMCFVNRFVRNDFISSDAMSKLRQKNPGAIRIPEENRGEEIHQHDLIVDLDKAHVISPMIYNICQEAGDSTYATEDDIRLVSQSLGKDEDTVLSATRKYSHLSIPKCGEVTDSAKQCICRYEVCVGWYPCGLKYCRGKDSTGRLVSYRCGIKTCKKCRVFNHYVKQKHYCLWDDV